ncbi:MAG TPA: FtsW/RodA/SpoVE family cell cycle protein [Armatimonadota bacterium]|nr:FtsW/RodA/SpoVE family cell cycle protein [Armatimonadota bacterium]
MGRQHRTTEGVLLLFASLVLLLGFALLFAAKLPDLKAERTANINSASPDEIASALMIDRGLAKLICDCREKHGPFRSTSALRDVRLLTPAQAKAVADLQGRYDITALTPGQLAARSGIGTSSAERLVEALAAWGDEANISAASLARIPVVGRDAIAARDSRLRVRDGAAVTISYWAFIAFVIAGFFLLHAALRRRAPDADPFILPCVFVLVGLGGMILFSIKDPLRDTYVFPAQMLGVLLGILAAMIPLSAKFRALRPWRYTYLYALFAVFLTLLLALFGTGPGGAKLRLFGFSPLEVVKLALVFFVASYLADRWSLLLGPPRRIRLPLFRDIGPLAVMYLLSLVTFVLVRDLGPMLLLFGMFVVMLYIATGKPSFVGVGLILVGITGALAYKLGLGVFDVRVDMWLHPWANRHANGMQLGQALWAFGTGGLWGSGPGLGQPAYMPRAGSDLVFASLGEELGLVGSLGILLLCSVIIARGFRIALHARTDFERLLAAGMTSLLGIQTVIIVFGVLGLTPLTGVTFPFVSYGKSSVIASFFIAGLLLNISAGGTRYASEVRVETRRALRGAAAGLLVLLLGAAGIGRLVWIQGIKADRIAGNTVTTPDADGFIRPHINPRLKSIEADIPRGTIYDRNGRPLATSRPSELAELGLSEAAVRRGGPGGRYYPYGASLAHLVGYIDHRCGGPVGLEKRRNNDLRGFDDYSALLPIYRRSHTPYCPKIEGRDIRLTIDAELQPALEKALKKYAASVRDRRTGERKQKGAAVVIDVYTGEILAAVSIPDFDPNELTLGAWRAYNSDRSGRAVLFNRALDGTYPPGSTFKLVTAAAALENGLDDFTHVCRHQEGGVRWRSGGQTYSRRRIADLEEMRPHGLTGLAKAIRASCNIYFAHLGLELGADKLYDMTRKFNLSWIAPPKRLVEDLPDNAYGQGTVQVSPLEMARVVAAIANGGVMMKPQFVKDVRRAGTDEIVKAVEPVEMGRPISPETAAFLRRAMADVTSVGTGRGLFEGLAVTVAGKTGSAENDQADGMPHSWFVGFAPVEDPRIAFAVVVENGGYGRDVAGKVCREIVKAAF